MSDSAESWDGFSDAVIDADQTTRAGSSTHSKTRKRGSRGGRKHKNKRNRATAREPDHSHDQNEQCMERQSSTVARATSSTSPPSRSTMADHQDDTVEQVSDTGSRTMVQPTSHDEDSVVEEDFETESCSPSRPTITWASPPASSPSRPTIATPTNSGDESTDKQAPEDGSVEQASDTDNFDPAVYFASDAEPEDDDIPVSRGPVSAITMRSMKHSSEFESNEEMDMLSQTLLRSDIHPPDDREPRRATDNNARVEIRPVVVQDDWKIPSELDDLMQAPYARHPHDIDDNDTVEPYLSEHSSVVDAASPGHHTEHTVRQSIEVHDEETSKQLYPQHTSISSLSTLSSERRARIHSLMPKNLEDSSDEDPDVQHPLRSLSEDTVTYERAVWEQWRRQNIVGHGPSSSHATETSHPTDNTPGIVSRRRSQRLQKPIVNHDEDADSSSDPPAVANPRSVSGRDHPTDDSFIPDLTTGPYRQVKAVRHLEDANALALLCKPPQLKKREMRMRMGVPLTRCAKELFGMASTKYTAQTVTWQVLWIMGHRIPPFMTQTGDHRIPKDRLKDLFMDMGCLTAFLENDKNATHEKHYTKKPTSLSLVGFGVECPGCGQHHHDSRCSWIDVLLIGCGILTPDVVTEIMANGYTYSHLCGYNWCINPFHIALEDQKSNNDRTKCHRKREMSKRRLAKAKPCAHDPPCILDEVDFHILFKENQDKVVEAKKSTNVSCIDETCSETGNAAEIMYHEMKIHAPELEPPRRLEELVLQCTGCEHHLITWNTATLHNKAMQKRKPCSTSNKVTLEEREVRERGRTLIAGLDVYVWP
ncbi:hypothetical protein LTR17_011856 [Elasticomyces elasticus]|nr:hypothetical protein LTR17_011856 [Elasticomyces elasticus]